MKAGMGILLVLFFGVWVQAAVITNADFETDPNTSGWSHMTGSTVMTHLIGGGPDASNCVKITKPTTYQNGGEGIQSAIFAIEPEINDQGYDFSVWVKATNVEYSVYWDATMVFYQYGWGQYNSWIYLVPSQHSTNGWQQFTTHLDSVPTGFGEIDLRLLSCANLIDGCNVQYDSVHFAAVPEPASLGFLGTALVGMVLRKRTK